jgi:hypothetical protein
VNTLNAQRDHFLLALMQRVLRYVERCPTRRRLINKKVTIGGARMVRSKKLREMPKVSQALLQVQHERRGAWLSEPYLLLWAQKTN